MTTALREVQEETGLEVIAGPEVGMIDYWFVRGGARIHKRVRWWLMEAVGGSVEMHDAEFDEVCWLPAAEAATILSYPDERGIVEKAMDIIDTRQPA